MTGASQQNTPSPKSANTMEGTPARLRMDSRMVDMSLPLPQYSLR